MASPRKTIPDPDEFERIMDCALAEAARVKVDQATYLEGLEAMEEKLSETITMVRDEVRAKGRR